MTDGLVHDQMADGTLQLVIDRVDEEGVNAHCLLLDADMSALSCGREGEDEGKGEV